MVKSLFKPLLLLNIPELFSANISDKAPTSALRYALIFGKILQGLQVLSLGIQYFNGRRYPVKNLAVCQ